MKIRESFVTNSSSSSYIIAKKKTASEEEIKTAIKNKYYKNKEEYLNLLGDIIEEYTVDLSDYEGTDYYGEAPLVKAYIKEENVDEEFIKYLTKRTLEIFDDNWNGSGELDSWEVTIFEASNENDDMFEWLLYNDVSIIKNELIKVI